MPDFPSNPEAVHASRDLGETVERWSDRIPWVIEDQRVEASGLKSCHGRTGSIGDANDDGESSLRADGRVPFRLRTDPEIGHGVLASPRLDVDSLNENGR